MIERDGKGLINVYKVALLYFKCYNHHHKYAFSVLKLLCSIKLYPERAFQLIWGRFANIKGSPGTNISLDLHLEHLNGFLKEQLRNLRVNLDTTNATRVSRSMNALETLISKVEDNFDIAERNSHRAKASTESDIGRLAMEFKNADVFKYRAGREFKSFPKFSEDLLKN